MPERSPSTRRFPAPRSRCKRVPSIAGSRAVRAVQLPSASTSCRRCRGAGIADDAQEAGTVRGRLRPARPRRDAVPPPCPPRHQRIVMNDPMRADTLIPPTWKPALAARMASLVIRGGFSGRTAKQPFPKISAFARDAKLSCPKCNDVARNLRTRLAATPIRPMHSSSTWLGSGMAEGAAL